MIEYYRHIEEYSNYWQEGFSELVPSGEWGDKQAAEEYLRKYWLSEREYLLIWKPIQDKIFAQGKSLPDLIYQTEFEMIALGGGCLFLEKDFKLLQKAMQELGEEYFVIVQHSQNFTEGEPMFRMKFPVNITWKEITSGNYISSVLLEMFYNEYFVFGKNEGWGKYSASDYDYPFDIIGFKPELSPIFKKYFKQMQKEQIEIQECLPMEYIKLIKL